MAGLQAAGVAACAKHFPGHGSTRTDSHHSLSNATSSNGDEEALPLAGGQSLWTARVAARSAITAGQPADLAIDTANLQFFDPVSGVAIGHPAAPAGA